MTWTDTPKADRIAHIGRTVVATPTHVETMSVFRKAFERFGTRREGMVSFVLAETRAGKTTAIEEFMHEVAAEIGGSVGTGTTEIDRNEGSAVMSVVVVRETFLERPVIKVAVDSMPSYKALFDDVLTAVLGMRPPRSMTTTQMKAALSRQLAAQKTRLLVFDEVQHIAEHRGPEGIYKAADVFKELMKTAGVQIVLVGLEHAEEIRSVNDQLGAMTIQVHRIEPYAAPTDEHDEFVKLLRGLEGEMPFDESSDIGSIDVAQRIHAHTDGFVGRIAHLLTDAVEHAIETGLDRVDRAVLASVVKRYRGVPDALNPFLVEDHEVATIRAAKKKAVRQAREAAEVRQTKAAGVRQRRRSLGTRGG
ncbi:AAA family ATPase [Antarcticirhabdus aurantiaca]|uniref:ATP-binding protein n=1 Tax=Antarcticirhabdus aurantiaca TaxID=2606717 RepID=A0ACD4NIY0_9HYPH|nr:ATP-binding protein [Jeongeuplla avenae]